MSTKIHDGYRIRETDLLKLKQLLVPLHQDVAVWMKNLCFGTIVADAVELFDDRTWKGLAIGQPLAEAASSARDRFRHIGKTMERDPNYDFDSGYVLLPTEGWTYLLLITEHEEVRRKFKRWPGIEWYGYWNHSDPPEGVSEEEWDERKRDWETALGPAGVPAWAGFVVESVCGWHVPPLPGEDDVEMYFPLLDARTERVAKDQLLSDYWASLPNLATDADSASAAIRRLFEFKDWVATKEGWLKLEAMRKTVEVKLDPVLTFGKLRGK